MIRKTLVAAAVAVQFSMLLTALAQVPDPPQPPRSDTVFFIANGGAPIMPLGGTVDVLRAHAGSVMGEVVEGKPYSAESVTESTQMLADGNRITTTNRARIHRDSAGRTRREQQLDAVGVWQANEPVSMITINDPVKNISYFLDPRTETVRELTPFRLEAGRAASADDAEGAERRVRVLPLDAGAAPAERANVVVHEYVGGEHIANVAIDTNAGHAPFEVALPPTGVAAIGSPMFGTVTAINGGIAGPPAIEDLGEQVLEGVLARGTRHTQTIPAGAIGNELPIEIVHEEWYSHDIEAVVLRRDFDPRFGETTYRLINVDRSEPAPELFAIPQGYAVQRDAMPRPVTRAMPAAPGKRVERRVFLVQPDPAPEAHDGE